MKHFIICILFVGVWAETVTINGTRGPTWGDITGEYAFQERITKSSIPFIKRDATIEYPELKSGQAIVVPGLRGLKHVNLVDKVKTECGDPKVVLKDGGPPFALAIIEITSERGCPLDSILTFYTNNK